jgi:hypothetical protein
MNLGIIVEGLYDSNTYPVIIRKIRQDIDRIYPVTCDSLPKNKFLGFLKGLSARRDLSLEKVLVIRDSDCAPAAGLEGDLRHRLRQSGFRPSFSVQFYATRCELESWLLADEDAINRVSLRGAGPGGIAPVPFRLEEYRDAKELLLRLLRDGGLPATPKVYAEIAAEASIERIGQRCPYFRQFVRRVEDC